jgi:outer membrane protein OmpA-like peptidoglycan-associated protein
MSRAQPSTLHLQMGQEVLYLLLVTSLICNVLLVAIPIHSSKRLDQPKEPLPVATNEPPPITTREQPPIITLTEAKGYSFVPGSADITPAFLALLAKEVVPKLSALGDEYGAQVVEIIGHTDGTSISDRLRAKANLDDFLGEYLDPSAVVTVFPYDNVGLGISRALSVARALRQSGLPAKFDIQPLSAAYLIAPNDRTLAARRKVDDPSRRRIEIRIRRVGANRSE